METQEPMQARLIALQALLGENVDAATKARIDAQIVAIMSENVASGTRALLNDRNSTSAEKARQGVALLKQVQVLMRKQNGQ